MEYVLTKTDTEKLEEIFFRKCSQILNSLYLERLEAHQSWIDYLNQLEGVEYIYQFSNHSNAIDYLFESINENSARRIVIKGSHWYSGRHEHYYEMESNADAQPIAWGKPHHLRTYILIDPEVAMKILTLRYLP